MCKYLYSSILVLASILLFLPGTNAQDIDLDLFEKMKPRQIGPAGMSGRVTSIDVDLSDPETIYVGTASGGAWKSTNGGINWEPIFDEMDVGSIGAIKVDQSNPSVIWAGTGEGNPRNSANAGKGIYKSLDGGATWTFMGLENTKTIHRIIIHRDNPDVVYVGAQGSQWGPNPERGVFRTKDGGKTWEKILYVDEQTGIADLVVDPSNPNKLVAAMWEYGRKPWTFNSGGPGSGIYVSYDGGDNWTRRTSKDGLPKGELGRIGLAFATNKPNIIYALVEAKENGLYKSTDGGKKWSLVSKKNIGNRPFYYAEIYVDPTNENRLYNLWSYVSKSEDGGKTFKTIMDYSSNVHPDHHAFWIHPEDGNYLIDGNDGGLNISRDGSKSWQFASNLPLAQFYHINYDMSIPYNVGGGMQDNGSWVGPSQAWKSGGITDADWQEIFFGDGFDVAFQPDNNRYAYAMSQGGNLGLVDRTTGATTFIKPVHPDGEVLRYNWNAALAQDPFDAHTIYYGSQYVHKSTDLGQNWEIISPDLTTNNPDKQKQDESGGLTIDATQAENNTTIVSIAPSPVDRNVIWVGTDDGNLQITTDGGTSWTNLADKLPVKEAWIPQIEVSSKNAGEAFIVVNNYRQNDYRPMVFHTTNYGQTLRRIVDEDNVSGYCRAIVQDPVEPNLLFLGTDHGLFFSLNKGAHWQKWDNAFPSVPVSDLKIHPREHDLIIGTFGRAAYILDDIRPLRALATQGPDMLKNTEFAFFDGPDAYLAEYRSYQGTRFVADAEFRGTNRRYGAILSYYVRPDSLAKDKMETDKGPDRKEEGEEKAGKDKKDKKKKPKKIFFKIVDSQGDTIRNFSRKVATGFNRTSWSLNQDGVSYPSRRERREDADPSGGASVLPGEYTIIAKYGDQAESIKIRVHHDPRIPYQEGQYDQRIALRKEHNKIVEAASTGFKRLRDARKSIELVNKAMTNLEKEMQDSLKKQGKELIKVLDSLELLYMMPEDVKGIQRDPNNLRGTLFGASRYISDIKGAPNQMARVMLDKARKQTQDALDQINSFLEGDYTKYREEVDAIKFNMFKEMEPVKIE